MKYLHTMVRVTDPAHSLAFYRDAPGLEVLGIRAFVTVPGARPSARRQSTSPESRCPTRADPTPPFGA